MLENTENFDNRMPKTRNFSKEEVNLDNIKINFVKEEPKYE